LCCPAPLACGNYSGEAERGSGIGLELFGFIPESVFTFIPDHCSESSRIGVRHHPGIAFTFPRNPQERDQGALLYVLDGSLFRENSAGKLGLRWIR